MKPIFQHLFKSSRKRESMANAEERMEEVSNADPGTALDADEDGWFKVSPYGRFPGSKPGRIQIFDKPEAQRMVSEFNSLRGKLGRMFRGLPIFIGHPDVNRAVWTDERRLGKVAEMQARDDGFWSRAEWNSLGRENIENGYWVYPSPRWDAPEGSTEFRPDRLLSIGMTNMPRIKISEPVANALGEGADVVLRINP
jgi:phage I-like protein